MTPDEALALARELHGDQVDKLGEDYVDGHLTCVQASVGSHNDSVLSIAAALHDTLEDKKTKAEKLFSRGVPLEVVRVIGIVTKRYNEHDEDGYSLFIERIIASGNRNAILLKLADVNDHLRPIPDGRGADEVARLVPRYELARRKLSEALEDQCL
jgi:(p)ppGpp synthase/HD superfamily hydrolase